MPVEWLLSIKATTHNKRSGVWVWANIKGAFDGRRSDMSMQNAHTNCEILIQISANDPPAL